MANRSTVAGGSLLVGGAIVLASTLAQYWPFGKEAGLGPGDSPGNPAATDEDSTDDAKTEPAPDDPKTEPVDGPGDVLVNVFVVRDDTIYHEDRALEQDAFLTLARRCATEGKVVELRLVRGKVTQGFINDLERVLQDEGVARKLEPVEQ